MKVANVGGNLRKAAFRGGPIVRRSLRQRANPSATRYYSAVAQLMRGA